MGGCDHRIGYLHVFTTSPPKLHRVVIFGSDTVSSDTKGKNRTMRVVPKLEERRNFGDEVKELRARIPDGRSHRP